MLFVARNFFAEGGSCSESIYIDGNISSGKSTLCTEIKNLKTSEVGKQVRVKVYYEIGHEDEVLDEYLKHQKELSAPFQIHMLSMCAAREKCTSLLVKMSAPTPEKKQLLVVDRSITGNGIFALANYVFSKFLTEVDFKFYKKVFLQHMKKVPDQQAFKHGSLSLYLHVPVQVAIERCATRDRAEEDKYDASYFKALEQSAMVALLANLTSITPHPQILLDWGPTFGKTEILARVVRAYNRKRADSEYGVPTRVTLSQNHCPVDDVDKYSAILDFSHAVSEEEFFSYDNAMTIMSLLCCRSPKDIKMKKHVFIRVPKCLTETPFDGFFKINIQL